MRLSLNDYISILKYYEIETSGMKTKDIKRRAEDILAKKLCRCIKAVDNKQGRTKQSGTKQSGTKQSRTKQSRPKQSINESKAIAICKNSVFTKKNLKIAKFKCKKSTKLLSSRKNNKLMKTKRNLLLRDNRR